MNINKLVNFNIFPTNLEDKTFTLIHKICNVDKIITKFIYKNHEEYLIPSPKGTLGEYPNELIQSKLHRSSGSRLYIIFPPWGSKMKLTDKLKDKIIEENYSCLQLTFPRRILCSDPKMTLTYFNDISKYLKTNIDFLKERYSFSEINLLGLSLGGNIALLCANNNKTFFNKLILVGASCNWGKTVFGGVATQKLKDMYKAIGENSESIDRKYSQIDPANLTNIHKDTKIIIHLGEYDTSMPYQLGKKLIKKMEIKGIKPIVKIHKQGHHIMLLDCLRNPVNYIS